MEESLSTEPKFRQIVESLKRDILDGKYELERPLPSIQALVRRLGVSSITVRRAFDVLKQEGFVVKARGRGTFVSRSGASRKIGLIVPGIAYSEFFPPIVSEISRLAQKESYTLLFGDISSKSPEQRIRAATRLAKDFVRQNVAGVLYQPVELVDDVERVNRDILSVFHRAKTPVVILDDDFVAAPRRSGYDVVGIDNHAAGVLAASHLLDMGVVRIGFQKRPKCSVSVNDRLHGVVSAIFDRLGSTDGHMVLEAEPTDEDAVRRYVRKFKPQAVVCGNDMAAVELKQSLGKLGLKVPDDVRLVGFDDVKCASIVTPGLTSVRQPCAQIAETAFYCLLRRIENPAMPTKTISLPVKLVVREST